MADASQRTSAFPFPPGYRAAGVLLHVTSLPSPYGIGDLGPTAIAWVDRLVASGQSWWQVLPLNPTGYGNSPYQPLSSFAGNDLLISPDWLIEDRLLQASDLPGTSFPVNTVDYDAVVPFKERLLEQAWVRFQGGARPDLKAAFDQFRHAQAHWLEDYSLFRALKAKHGGAHYLDWPTELVRREPAALTRARQELSEGLEKIRFRQFLVFRQAARLKEYAHGKGLRVLGDLPFFVSPDSADVWANPDLFLLDDRGRPNFVAGVPPDYFSPLGQLWGNPVYNWEALRRSGHRWWVDRLRALLAQVDLLRLDHFRAFVNAWHIPAGSATAQTGEWRPGPGAEFFTTVQKTLGRLPFVAEDLGLITDDVRVLRDQFHLPGMLVLQFAFDGSPDNPFLPHKHVESAVVYTGTHDNDTTRGWYETLPDHQRQNLWNTLKRSAGEGRQVAWELIRLVFSSVAALAVIPLQDLLNLGSEARMNRPGEPDGNWRWRCTTDMLGSPAFGQLRDLTEKSKRLGKR
jgi:4-alpha-glucanotransferase